MKIAVLGTRGFPGVQGGVEAHCENLYPRLAELGCDVAAFTRAPYVNPNIKEYKNVKLYSLTCPKTKALETLVHTFKGVFAARRMNPDILHIHAIGPSLFAPLARILGMKVVITNHGPDYKRKKWGYLGKTALVLGETLGTAYANEIICISGHIARHIYRIYGREGTLIPNGVVMPKIVEDETTLRKYGLDKGKYILAVGRFVPEKGFHDLIGAFDRLYSMKEGRDGFEWGSIDGWKLVLVGRPDHEDRYSLGLKKTAQENENMILTGFLTGAALKELYIHAGLFVLPSYYEGLSITLLEAMSYGLSCIASDIPANREVALPDERYFKAGDVKGLADKMRKFMTMRLNEGERQRMTDLVKKKYDWDDIAARTMSVYKKAVG